VQYSYQNDILHLISEGGIVPPQGVKKVWQGQAQEKVKSLISWDLIHIGMCLKVPHIKKIVHILGIRIIKL